MSNLSKCQFGPFEFDVRERLLLREGRPIPLTPKAFDLLATLVEQPGRLLTKEDLLRTVWPDTFVEEANLAYNIFALRKALGDSAEHALYIQTVPKQGYRFTATVTPVVPAASKPESSSSAVIREGHHEGLNGRAVLQPMVITGEPPSPAIAAPRPFLARRPVQFGLAIVLAGVLLIAWQWRGSLDAPEPAQARPLTSLTGAVRAPSLSPDGNYVAFGWSGDREDNPDIYVQQIGAGSPLRLTSHPDNDHAPSWSPDGRAIAFLRRLGTNAGSEVRLVAPLGGQDQKLADMAPRVPAYRQPSVSWCPDSTCVLVTDSVGPRQPDAIFAVDVRGGSRRQLTHPEGLVADTDPAISPDGRYLVFRRNTTPFSGKLYRLALRGAASEVPITPTLAVGKPAWMPGGREILLGGRGALWRLDALQGGAPARLPFVGQDGASPVVARMADGRLRLVYVRNFSDGNIWRLDLAHPGALSPVPVKAIASTRTEFIPNLAPDGRRVVFLANRSGDLHVWVADADGANATQVTTLAFLSAPGFARWSPDGEWLAFHGDPDGRPDVVLQRASGGPARIMTRELPNGGFPSFSRDGRWIYFCVIHDGQKHIWKMAVQGGAAQQVTTEEATLGIESVDGRDLFYVTATERPSAIWRMPVDGGAPEKVVDGVINGSFDVVEAGIYYLDRVSGSGGIYSVDRPGGETRLQFFDFATRESTTVAGGLGAVGAGLTASRDGRTVFFSRFDASVEELMVVDDFK